MKINNLLLIGAFFFILCCFPFIELQANELKPTYTIEYFDDGSYYEITLQEDLNIFRSSTKNGSKTVTYKSANGTTLWSVTVHGSFSFNGTSAKCTNSTVSTTCPASTWKITSASSSKSGASASATATAKQYISGKLSQTKTKTVTLQCSSSGKLS